MPRPSYEYLMNQLRECQIENGALSTDDEWNVTTLKALPFRLRREAESARWVALARIHTRALDGAQDSLNGSIRRVVNVRDAGVLVRARWNESEVIFVLSTDPEGLCGKLTSTAKNEGLKLSLAYVPYSGNIGYDHDRAAQELSMRSLQ